MTSFSISGMRQSSDGILAGMWRGKGDRAPFGRNEEEADAVVPEVIRGVTEGRG